MGPWGARGCNVKVALLMGRLYKVISANPLNTSVVEWKLITQLTIAVEKVINHEDNSPEECKGGSFNIETTKV